MSSGDVSLTSVTKRFGATYAVDDMTLEIPAGQFVSLLGPSGCGKSTTLRLIGGFERPDAGTIAIRGRRVDALPPHQRDTAMVFQDYALFPHLSVAGNVGFGLVERGIGKREIAGRLAAILDLVALPDARHARIQELSGGQRQRVALARALILEPAVLLLDEPLGALDLSLRRTMQGELRRMQRATGTTFVHVTHDQHEALSMSDRIVVMNAGRIVQAGTPRAIFEHPANRFVATFMGARNVLDAIASPGHGSSMTVRVGANTVDVPRRETLDAGPVVLVIRPERIRLARRGMGETTGARWPGVIREQTYTGAAIACDITLADGTPLVADIPADGRSPILGPGDPVDALFDPDDVTVIEP